MDAFSRECWWQSKKEASSVFHKLLNNKISKHRTNIDGTWDCLKSYGLSMSNRLRPHRFHLNETCVACGALTERE